MKTQIRIKPLYVASELFHMLEDGPYFVHSKFYSGFNIKFGNILCFAGNKNQECLPYGILISEHDQQNIIKKVQPEKTFFDFNQNNLCIESEEIKFDLKDVLLYTSHLPIRDFCIEKKSIELVCYMLKEYCGFGADDVKNSGHFGLLACFNSEDPVFLRAELKKWIGKGIGLTPSGDDIILGVLLVNELLPYLTPIFLKELEKLVYQDYTTDISINNYLCAFNGYYCGSFRWFANTLEMNNIKGIEESLIRISKFGGTSGRDMITGLYLGFYYLLTRI